MKRLFPYFLPFVLLTALVALHYFFPAPFEALRFRYFDALQQIRPRPYQDVRVRVVDLDEATLEKYGQWPWPRTMVAELVERLNESGASVIAFDILFAEPDRTSPRHMISLWKSGGIADFSLSDPAVLPDHDEVLAQSFKGKKIITAFAASDQVTGDPPRLKAGFAFGGEDPRSFLPPAQGWVKSLSLLEEAAAGNGSITFYPDHDMVLRRIPLLFSLRESVNPYPSLAGEALRLFQGASAYRVRSSDASGEAGSGQKTGIISVRIGAVTIPTDAQGRMWLYDTGPVAERMIPAWKVLNGSLKPGSLEGAIVFIGTSATGLKDIRSTPLNPVAAGVEVHAQLAEQALTGTFLHRLDWAEGAEFILTLAAGLLLILLMPVAGAAWCALLGAVAFAAVYAFSWYAFSAHQWLFEPLLPSIACLLIYLASSLIHFLKTDAEKRQVRLAFSRYLAPAIVEHLAAHPEKLKLGGEIKEMTVLFADIQDFTALSEKLEPHELTSFMNRFLTPMTGIILEHGGTIDKYMGDCIMAFWNAPLDDTQHARRACLAALKMQEHLGSLDHPAPLRLGIGINTGPCCVGNMGSQQRFDYSILGDTVNLASRIEGLCRLYQIPILVGENTWKDIQDLCTLEVDLVRVKGKSAPSRLYGLLGGGELQLHQAFRLLQISHQKMLEAYRSRDWQTASRLARECGQMKVPGIDLTGYYQFFLGRIEKLRQESPGAEWDGVTVSASK